MTQVRKRGVKLTPELELALTIGPGPLTDDLSGEDLAVGWHLHGAEIMEGWKLRDGSRPYGWWRFEIGETSPPLAGGDVVLRPVVAVSTSSGKRSIAGDESRRRSAPAKHGEQRTTFGPPFHPSCSCVAVAA